MLSLLHALKQQARRREELVSQFCFRNGISKYPARLINTSDWHQYCQMRFSKQRETIDKREHFHYRARPRRVYVSTFKSPFGVPSNFIFRQTQILRKIIVKYLNLQAIQLFLFFSKLKKFMRLPLRASHASFRVTNCKSMRRLSFRSLNIPVFFELEHKDLAGLVFVHNVQCTSTAKRRCLICAHKQRWLTVPRT